MNHCRPVTALATLFTLQLLLTTDASAQALHQGDIFPAVQSGVITIANGATIDPAAAAQFSVLGSIGGQKIFSGDFRDLPGGLYRTSNPGFNWLAGQFAGDTGFPAGSLLGFQAVGALSFWNGSAWVAAPTGVTVSLDDAIGTRISWGASGITTASSSGFIEQSNGGEIHQHLDFRIAPANATTPVGAWLINLSLFSQIAPADIFNVPAPSAANRSPGIADSAAFSVVLNGGLTATAFSEAVASLTEAPPTPVPVPLPLAMLAATAGSLLLSGLRGCRRQAGIAG